MKGIANKVRKRLGINFHRKPFEIPPSFKAITFTFDDAPISAFSTAGTILKNHNIQATYYIALSFLESPVVKEYFDIATLTDCLADGHELACHTYDHFHFFDEPYTEARKDIEKNLAHLKKYFPNQTFQNFSYPFGEQTKSARNITKNRFRSARSIEYGVNLGNCDLNGLKTIPLYEKRFHVSEQVALIKQHQASGGWLIFYTHDVQKNYSKYGCSPEYFDEIVEACMNSGTEIINIKSALNKLQV